MFCKCIAQAIGEFLDCRRSIVLLFAHGSLNEQGQVLWAVFAMIGGDGNRLAERRCNHSPDRVRRVGSFACYEGVACCSQGIEVAAFVDFIAFF